MNNILTIFKKEFYRVMSDKRLIFTTIILPGLAIYLMYSAMGGAINSNEDVLDEHQMNVYVLNLPEEIETFIVNDLDANVLFTDMSSLEEEEVMSSLKDGEIDLVISFEEDFMSVFNDYENPNYVLPNIDFYFNPGERFSSPTLSNMTSYINAYLELEAQHPDRYGEAYNLVSYNKDNGGSHYVVQYENKGIGQGLSMLLPMLIIMFLFSGAMSIGPDSIAGEKERGTIATLLVTPVKRSEIAIGKVLSLSVISVFSAISSFIGIMLSLPKLIGVENLGDTPVYAIYSASDYLMLLSIIFVTVLVIVGLISVISAYAKTIKEASTLIMPFYFISVFIGISTMFSGESTKELAMYLIPIYNSVNMIIAILSFEVDPTLYMVTLLSSVVYVSIFIYVLNRFFQSEKLMFNK